MLNHNHIQKGHFELYDSFIPGFRLLLTGILILINFYKNGFDLLYRSDFLPIEALLLVYFLYSFILLILKKFRRLLAFQYPYVMALFESMLVTCAITLSGGAQSPFYLLYLLFVSFFAMVYSLKYAMQIGCVCSACFTVAVLLVNHSLPIDYIIKVVFLLGFSYFIGTIAERIKKHDLKLATTDQLTNLYNRQYFYEEFESILSHNKNATLLSLVVFDIDHFKNINDQQGHLEGDRILAEIGALIRQNIREEDLAARYGGDEFVIVLPGTEKDSALALCERLRNAIKARLFDKVTISVGLAIFPADGVNTLDLFRAADFAMYREKALKKGIGA